MEKTYANSTPPGAETDSNPTTKGNGSLVRCARCETFFTPPKRQGGIFRSWLEGYCEPCKKLVEEGWRLEEAARIDCERLRATQERERRQIEVKVAALGGIEPYERFTFEFYDPNLNGTHEWFKYAQNFPLDAKNLFVYGPTGVGKTHLCTAIVRGMWKQNGTVRAFTAKELVTHIYFNDVGRPRNSFDQRETLYELANIDALLVDELDKMKPKEEHVNLLQELVDIRGRRRKYGLLMASNVDLMKIASILGDPIADRLDGRTFEVFRIPENTPSVRGILKRIGKVASEK